MTRFLRSGYSLRKEEEPPAKRKPGRPRKTPALVHVRPRPSDRPRKEAKRRLTGSIDDNEMRLGKAIKKRLASASENVKTEAYTVNYMLHDFKARVYKPQRLLSIPLAEEERRALAGWKSFDNTLMIPHPPSPRLPRRHKQITDVFDFC